MNDIICHSSSDTGRAAGLPVHPESNRASGSGRRQPSAHGAARQHDAPLPQVQRPRVLHVDADPDSALLLATLLVPETDLTHVDTLAAALRAIGQTQYSLIVLDPQLADGDGVALLKALRAAGSRAPVLLYAEQETDWRDQASAFLHKPWASPRQLWGAAMRLAGLRPPAVPLSPA